MSDQPNISVEDLTFYFDACVKDARDRGRRGGRLEKIAALRDELLVMSDGQFELAVKMLGGFTAGNVGLPQNGKDQNSGARQRQETMQIMDYAARPEPAGSAKAAEVSPI